MKHSAKYGIVSISVLLVFMLTFTILYMKGDPTITGEYVQSVGSMHVDNTAPKIIVQNQTVYEGQRVELNVSTEDINNDKIELSYSGWMNSSVYWTDFNDSGTHHVRVCASDSHNTTCANVKILVLDRVCNFSGSLYTKFDSYTPGVPLKVKGINFTHESIIELNFSLDNFTVKRIGTGENGNFSITINTTGFETGTYNLTAIDPQNICRNDQKTITIEKQYKITGKIFSPINTTVPSELYLLLNQTVVAEDDEVYEFLLDHGRVYDLEVVPENVSGLESLYFKQITNAGNNTDILGIDNNPEEDERFINLFGYMPNLKKYKSVTLNISHPKHALFIYKCENWSFYDRKCTDENSWSFLGNANEGQNYTIINLDKGDPGVGVVDKLLKNYCGDGICNDRETCQNCPSDCGSCGGGGGGSGFDFETCLPDWECTNWTSCYNTTQNRVCLDQNECGLQVQKPVTERQCLGEPEQEQEDGVDFGVLLQTMYVTLLPGETVERPLIIHNKKSKDLNLNLDISEKVKEFVHVNNESMFIGANRIGSKNISFEAGKTEGVYKGHINLTSANMRRKVPVIVEIIKEKSFEQKIDLTANLLSKWHWPGSKARYRLDLRKIPLLNSSKQKVELRTTITGKDKIHYYGVENLNLEDSLNIKRNATLPETLKPGSYSINFMARMDASRARYKLDLEVKPRWQFLWYKYQAIVFLLLILLLIVLFGLLMKHEKKPSQKNVKKTPKALSDMDYPYK